MGQRSEVSMKVYIADVSLQILKDWIALIDEDGWVAREQILGEESRSKVGFPVDTADSRYRASFRRNIPLTRTLRPSQWQ